MVNPITRTYRLFKQNFGIANHLLLVRNTKYRIVLSKFRNSSHLLAIEQGRHTKPKTDIEKRLCHFCNIVEDEIHFLVNCGVYSHERKTLFDKAQSKFPNFLNLDDQKKFVMILSCDDSQVLTSVGKFLHLSFLKREEFLSCL